jgi:DHA2 family multidrug resistance protein
LRLPFHLPPITAAGAALHPISHFHPRLSANTLRPYIGILGWLLKRIDGRLVLGFGSAVIGIACLLATDLTSDWATNDFLASQILQALGQSFALTSLIVLAMGSINPTDALTVGALLQTSRLFGGEIGTAFMQTFVRVREQVHSNLIGLHIDSLAAITADRIALY